MQIKSSNSVNKKACNIKRLIKNGQVIRILISAGMLLVILAVLFIDNNLTNSIRQGLRAAFTYDMSMGGIIEELSGKTDIDDNTAVEGNAVVMEPYLLPADRCKSTVYDEKNGELKMLCGTLLSIRAMNEGEITQTSTLDDGTFILQITHPDGIKTVYKNCAKLFVKQGDTVKRGQLIGIVNTSDNLLYVSLYEKGAAKNPLDYID